ncbi:MAG: dockerin type I repeat-containing protein, partial [Oscillospiraceae bacterium]|nr:dockerin type I repeat-containing protein [Oscillospiraceae bacterium]
AAQDATEPETAAQDATEPETAAQDATEPATEEPTAALLPPVVYCQEYYGTDGDFSLRIKCVLIDGAQGYHYEVSTDPSFQKPMYSFDRPENDVRLKKNIEREKTYYIRVRAYAETGETTLYSPYSVTQYCAPAAADSKLDAPALSNFTVDAEDKIMFLWTPVEGAQYYEIDIARNPEFTDPLHKKIGGAYGGYQLRDIEKNVTYWFRIRSTQENADGVVSSVYRTATVCIPDGFAILLGDINANKTVNASDAAKVLIAAASLGAGKSSGLTTMQTIAADVNGDRTVNASDAAVILVYAAALGAGQKDVSITDFVKS